MPRHRPAQPLEVLDATPPPAHDAGSAPKPRLRPFTDLATEDYCIRLATRPGRPCAECRAITGVGPVGHRNGRPICDECLLVHCHELGMVLALSFAARRLARSEPGSGESREALEALAETAWRYEEVIGETGPPRRVNLP